jgi:hypothetical protein
LVGVIGRRAQALAQLIARGVHDAKSNHWLAHERTRPRGERPGVNAKWGEAFSVRNGHLGDETDQPTPIVKAPHEVNVLASAQRLVEPFAVARSTNDEAGTRHVADRARWHHQCASTADVQWAEALFESITY